MTKILIKFLNSEIQAIHENSVIEEAVEYSYPSIDPSYKDYIKNNNAEWRPDGWLYVDGFKVCRPLTEEEQMTVIQ